MNAFITQSLEGDYPPFGENRLTQLTAASFNHSRVFRTYFLKFLGARNPNNVAHAYAVTQSAVWLSAERGQLDLEIARGSRIVAVVENKVDAPLHPRQLRHYNGVARLKTARKVALVRDYFAPRNTVKGWSVLHWRDFYVALRSCLDRAKPLSPLDAFILLNFTEYLESAHMHTPTRISKAEMKELAVMLHGLRFAHKTKFKWLSVDGTAFETAANWTRMMEAIFDECRLVPKLKRAAKKNFRFNPGVSHWSDGEGKNTTYPWIALHWQIWFKKPHGKTKALGLGFFVDEKGKWNIDAYRHVVGEDNIESQTVVDGRQDIVLTKLSKSVLRKWQKWLP